MFAIHLRLEGFYAWLYLKKVPEFTFGNRLLASLVQRYPEGIAVYIGCSASHEVLLENYTHP